MRYIGNKSKLIPFIRQTLGQLGIEGKTACDPFAGTAAVARFLKNHGYAVATSDIMSFSFVLQWAYVVVDQVPAFDGLAKIVEPGDDPLAATVDRLNGIEPIHEFIYDHFSPEGHAGSEHERRYFTPENAARIDAVRRQIWDWHQHGQTDDDEHYVLLAALIEAADRVANTTGVFVAFGCQVFT